MSDTFFKKVINFSATPDPKKGQHPDVEITDAEAVQAKLIKKVELGNEEETVVDAINKFEEIPHLLQDLSKYAKRNRIFISGSYCREIDESDDDYKKLIERRKENYKYNLNETVSIVHTEDIAYWVNNQ